MMIKNSFVLLPGISKKSEQMLWNNQIRDWTDFGRVQKIKGISLHRKFKYNRLLREASSALSSGNSSYFVGVIPNKEMWRLYDYFKDEACFIDIEVDSFGKIVIVGISNYFTTNTFVNGVNIEKGLLEKELAKYKLAITFNGSSFDLPKLEKQVGIRLTIPHVDLKPLCLKLGMVGGLKKIEQTLGLKRPSHLYGNPVELWKAFHASGDREYLELLIQYNAEDIENLRGVMNFVYNRMREKVYKQIS